MLRFYQLTLSRFRNYLRRPTQVVAAPDSCLVEDLLVLRIGKAGDPCELLESLLFSPRADSDFGIVELVVPTEHRVPKRTHRCGLPPNSLLTSSTNTFSGE